MMRLVDRREGFRLILVVEDNTGNQLSTKAVLEHLGYSTRLVSNGEEAVAAFESDDFELILMDCLLPVMDGYQAARQIRHAEAGRQQRVPIIAVTACAMEGDRERCLAAGMDDYVAKPVTIEAFKEVLVRWLPRSAA